MFTLARFAESLGQSVAAVPVDPPGTFCVALSGGLDSTVLLSALAGLQRAESTAWRLRAVHVDHSLHPDSARWSTACVRAAAALGVDCEVVRVDARPAPGASPEAAARAARYAALTARLRPGEALVTAHHADDQLESVLLQWLRGGGLRAVAGMGPATRLDAGNWHLRPLLGFTRAQLEHWARQEALQWLTDPSNADTRYDRNYLRHEVLPALRRRWPAAATTVGRVAAHARDALLHEDELAAADLTAAREGCTLRLDNLAALPESRQRAVLRAWLRALMLPVPPQRTLAALRRDIARAADDRLPVTRWPGAAVHRYRGRLYAERAPGATPGFDGTWLRAADALRYAWDDGSSLELVADVGRGLARNRLPEPLQVRRRAGGERWRPSGSAHRRELRKWLQEAGVLPWRRDSVPLLCNAAGEIVAVADLACADGWAARADEPSWRVVWHRNGASTERAACSAKWRGDPPFG